MSNRLRNLTDIVLTIGLFTSVSLYAGENIESEFAIAKSQNWQRVLHDPGTDNWEKNWFTDGEVGYVENTPNGMIISAGPEAGNHTHHFVAWTKEVFSGDLRIDFTYTRLDDATKFVNVFYLYATGLDHNGFSEDIYEWKELRKEPYMRHYFDNMNAYHISYAAYGLEDEETPKDYIRARRYMPEMGKGLSGTALEGDYSDTGFFAPNVPNQVTIIKYGDNLWMEVSNEHDTNVFEWPTSSHPDLKEGRIGIRHMFTRKAMYENFSVSTLASN
ncbi:DUF1961 family protein [Vibrio astriarenae]|uniref:DUF1961 family protein n=1 Tax=Vibrio astriarenae TaxID=1481923 RepID=A0A7Z2YFF3_9VIBR|nr:DUF1961 family protein [Vibrio astriarenae]QIA65447.1 DUF1961 family protein [Vibrio astriarenae]